MTDGESHTGKGPGPRRRGAEGSCSWIHRGLKREQRLRVCPTQRPGGPGAACVLLVIGSGQLLCLLVVSVFMVS